MKKLIMALILAVVWTYATTIVTTFPAYDVVLKEAFPTANIVLLTRGAGDPHEYQLTVQDVEFLKSLTPRDIIVSTMHAPFELKITEMAKRGEIKAKIIDVTEIQKYITFDGREITLEHHDKHHDEHHDKHHDKHHDEHDHHKGVNMHDHGVYPPNVLIVVRKISELTGLTPDREFMTKLETMDREWGGKYGGRAVAITPMAQYLLYWLGYRDIVVLIREPGVPPTPEELSKALQYVREGAPAVAAVARGERLRIVDQFVAKAREAGVEPKVVTVAFGTGYLSNLEKFAREMATATPTAPTTTPTAQPDVASLVWIGVAVAVVVAIVLFLKKRR